MTKLCSKRCEGLVCIIER
uniref:Uncharacterized protein n=1 Tax=Arundo donax TaxID=35708 RepID=A0A0A9C1H2_ARUDO